MANTDNGTITRLENRLTRLGQARETLDIVRMRLYQIKRRAPNLKVIVEGGLENLDEALAEIEKEFQETKRERWPDKNQQTR